MNLAQQVKPIVGQCLIGACQTLPWLKPRVSKWGMRTRKEWFSGRVVTVQQPDGKEFRLASAHDNYLSFELFWRGAGYYEPITNLLVHELLEPGDTFIDIGANIGFYSLSLATGRPGLNIIAFEPNPKNHSRLLENMAVNKFHDVRCESCALSDSEGTAMLCLSESDMSASLSGDFDSHPAGSVTVHTTTLDSYLAKRPVSGHCVIKIDVEGHEAAVFRGARKTLATLKPDVIAEVAVSYPTETIQLLREAGYRFYPVTDRGAVESKTITPVVRDRFVFLNYLLSARPPEEVARNFAHIQPQCRQIDLTQTSKYLSPEALRDFHSRQTLHELAGQAERQSA